MPRYLTKSAFTKAITCPTKLFYYLHDYPTVDDENEYLQMLAEGGFIIGALAKLLYPEGIPLKNSGDPERDFSETKELLSRGDVTLFEATIFTGMSYAIADILEKKGNTLKIIEVKSKSFSSVEEGTTGAIFRNKDGSFKADDEKYIYDLAFQIALALKALPELKIDPYLLLVDKAKRAALDGLPKFFSLENSKGRPTVSISGDPSTVVEGSKILNLVDMKSEIQEVLQAVYGLIADFEDSLRTDRKIAPQLGKMCRKCEYKGSELSPSGYSECWKNLSTPEHHIFDLYYGTTIKAEKEFLFDQMIAQGKLSLFDVPLSHLKNKRGDRQRIQIEHTKSNTEWIDPKLRDFVETAKYPLHFIDFETTRAPLPFHSGLRPFEQVAFQWSCHTVQQRGEAPAHSEWINSDLEFPNFHFAESLMKTLSSEGTVLTWSHHEKSVLSDILRQLNDYEYKNNALRDFFSLLVSSKGVQGRLVDMNRLTIDHYFHPKMKGRTSIKKVFPAVWELNSELRQKPWFKEYEIFHEGSVQDPYQSLPPMMIAGSEVSVNEGTAAMRAYEEMLFGDSSKDPAAKDKWRKLLLQYCKLDTLAMVFIWQHWESPRVVN